MTTPFNPINNVETEQSLVNYTQDIVQKTQEIMNTISPIREKEADELEEALKNQNRDFFRACTVFVLSQMNQEEWENLNSKELDFKKIIQLTVEKAPMASDIRAALTAQLDSITEQDAQSQTIINQKLNLIDGESLVHQFYKFLYESFHQNPEVDKAYLLMIL